MKVVFLYNEKESDLFAYFPDNIENLDFRLSYSHIGQHSSCHPDYANESVYATKEQYSDLLNELIQIGYKELQVLNFKDSQGNFI